MGRHFCLLGFLVISLLAATSSGSFVNCPGMSQDAKDYALAIKQNLNITGFEGKCTPVYRLDLPKKYIAYYILLTDKDYIIMSAGKKTDECKIVVQAELPSPITVMDKIAEKDGGKCDRYYLLAEDGGMICKDKKGKALANTFPDRMLGDILKKYDSLDKFIDARAKDWKKDWKERGKRCSKSGKEKKKKKPEGKSSDDAIECQGIEPGQTISIALGDGVTQVQIMQLPMDGSDNAANDAIFISLCNAVTGCSEDDDGIISPKPDGDVFDLVLSSNAPVDALFKVVAKYSAGSDEERCFQVMAVPTGKGSMYYESTSWSQFATCFAERYLPKYCGFFRYGCWWGGGGLIWAQIFASYDRSNVHLEHCLFTDAWNGVYPGSCDLRAPEYMTERVKNYIIYMERLVKTNCRGSTGNWNMGNVESFFKWKVPKGLMTNPRIIRKDKDDAWIVDQVCEGLPVAVLHKHTHGAYWYHAVVGTRWRRYWWRYCHRHCSTCLYHCNGWNAVYDRDYLLDFATCGSREGWYNMNNYYAGVAIY